MKLKHFPDGGIYCNAYHLYMYSRHPNCNLSNGAVFTVNFIKTMLQCIVLPHRHCTLGHDRQGVACMISGYE